MPAPTLGPVSRRPEPKYPVTEHFRDLVHSDLTRLGMTEAALARKAGIKRQLLTEMMKGRVGRSSAVPKILAALGRPVHHAYPLTDLQREILDALDELVREAPDKGVEWVQGAKTLGRGLVR